MINVVMAYIFDSEDKVLIAQRNLAKHFGGLWEFPGGKIEDGETCSQAIIRELDEELSIEVIVQKEYEPYIYTNESLNIQFYPIHCAVIGGELQNNEHGKIVFVGMEEIDSYEFAPPDYIAVEILKTNYNEMRIK